MPGSCAAQGSACRPSILLAPAPFLRRDPPGRTLHTLPAIQGYAASDLAATALPWAVLTAA